MDKKLIKILKLLKKYNRLNYYQLKMYIYFKDFEDYCENLFYLMDEEFIYYENTSDSNYSYDKTDESHILIPAELFFKITPKGINYLSDMRQKYIQFTVNSIIIPLAISIITSFLTAYFTIKLTL